MPHLILLGDSILDNGHYTKGGPDVVSQVRTSLPPGWDATLLAIDGSTTENISAQMERLPRDASHLVLSVGGNDALMHSSGLGFSLFGFQAESKSNPVEALANILQRFEADYRKTVSICLRAKLPLCVCTIYNCWFPEKSYQRMISTGLTIFNDVILRVAIENKLLVLDLRFICVNEEDYANPIEPSSIGGQKIAEAIIRVVTASTSFCQETRIFTDER
jgi:hypothetical protein